MFPYFSSLCPEHIRRNLLKKKRELQREPKPEKERQDNFREIISLGPFTWEFERRENSPSAAG
jgi:hypothetical protein